MSVGSLINFFALLVLLYTSVHCQICTETSIQNKPTYITYTHLRRVSFTHEISGRVKTTYKIATSTRPVENLVPVVIQTCCHGYVKDEERILNNDTIKCMPMCTPPCQNGACTSPGYCECDPGYSKDTNGSHLCQPVCTKSCGSGRCIAPEICETDVAMNSTNDPGSSTCLNETLAGSNSSCEPYCSSGCDHGNCIASETCQCDNGWQVADDNRRCTPICSELCYNGRCIGPDTCECNHGYHKSPKLSTACIKNEDEANNEVPANKAFGYVAYSDKFVSELNDTVTSGSYKGDRNWVHTIWICVVAVYLVEAMYVK